MPIPVSEDQIELWKQKYLDKGLPESLLDAMIAEAELEWESVIGYGQLNRLASLTVVINDYEETEGCFYKIVIAWEGYVIQGKITEALSEKFAQVQCVTLDIEVFKMSSDRTICRGYGYIELNHSQDESVTVTLMPFDLNFFKIPPMQQLVLNIDDGFLYVTEQVAVNDAVYQVNDAKPSESVVIVNE